MLNVYRKDNLGNISDRRFHDVYLTILLFFICHHLFGKDYLLQKAIQDQEGRVYDKDRKGLEKE